MYQKKNLHLHYIHLPEKSTDLEYLEEHAAWTNNDSTFNENARHVEVLSFTLNYFTPPHSFDVRGKKKNSHRSPQAIRMAVYDASQWGCAQLRPANETRTFGTIRPFSNIILCSPAANWTWWKAKGWFWCCCLGANCWRRPRGQGYLFLNKNIKKQQLSFCLKTLSLALTEVLCPGLFLRMQTTNQAK